MNKLFVDTNVVIDLLAKRKLYFEEAAALFSMADRKQVEIAVSSLTMATTGYILMRQMDASGAKRILRKLRLMVRILPLDDKIIDLALNDEGFSDFEDAIQYFSARENGRELIVTRNLKDYKASRLPVMTGRQFIETFRK